MWFWRKRKVERIFDKMFKKSFPGEEKQLEAEAGQLFSLLNQKVSLDEAKTILVHAKARLLIQNISANYGEINQTTEEARANVTESIRIRSHEKLTQEESNKVLDFVMNKFIEGQAAKGFVVGNTGSSDKVSRKPDDVVTINAKTALQGISMEYEWLESRYGKQDKDWKVLDRAHGYSDDDGKAYEIFTISTNKVGTKVIAFEISSWYQK